MSIINNKNEEKDSSRKTWIYYKTIYTEEHWPLIKIFDLENVCTYEERKRKSAKKLKRYRAYIKNKKYEEYIRKFGSEFSLGGECDFNFNFNKRKQFEKLIEGNVSEKESRKQLEKCCSMHHNKLNFSVMPTTGSMNNFKGQVYFDKSNIKYEKGKWHNSAHDRLDTFVYCLNDFFKTNNEFIFSDSTSVNKYYLKMYLKTFDDIYDYCKKIYFIDRKFVDKLIENGRKPINDANDLHQYMNLATKYWEIKKSSIISS